MGMPPPGAGPGRFMGHIKSFNVKQGYGFIDCPEARVHFGRDVFLHRRLMGDLEEGDQVTFTVEPNEKGMPQARDILRMDGRPPGPGRSDGDNGKGGGKGKAKAKGERKRGKKKPDQQQGNKKKDGDTGNGGRDGSEEKLPLPPVPPQPNSGPVVVVPPGGPVVVPPPNSLGSGPTLVAPPSAGGPV